MTARTDMGTGAGQFNFCKYGVWYEFDFLKSGIGRKESALKFWYGYVKGYGDFFKIKVRVRIPYPYPHFGECYRRPFSGAC